MLARKEILEESTQVKENVSCDEPLTCRSLSLAMKDLWDGRIKIVRRGERKNQQFFYVNIRKKSNQSQPAPNNEFSSLFSNNDFPTNWSFIADNQNRVNFIRLENWTYRQNRVKTELSVTKTAAGAIEYSISCRGQEVEINTLVQSNTLAEQSLKEKVITIMKLLDVICVEASLLKTMMLNR